MSLSLFGQVTDIQTTSPVDGATIIIVEMGTTEILYTATTSVASAGPGGYFTFNFTFEEVQALLGGYHHRTITLKVYDGAVFLGSKDVVVSAISFMGTTAIAVEVDASYNPPNNGFLYAVSGKVVEENGDAIPNLDVKIYEKRMNSEVLLETEQTSADGRFLLRYEGPEGSHPDQALIDIIVRAYDGANLVATAGPICNPRHDLTLVLVRDDVPFRGEPSATAFRGSIQPLLDGLSLADLTAEQVYYLFCKTGYDESTLATVARSHNLAQTLGLDADVFYGLAHAGFPLSTNSLVGLDADAVEEALLLAIADNAIPKSIEADIPTITAALAAARVERAVPSVNPETTTLGAVLTAAASLAAGVPRSFAEEYLAHTGTTEDFWTDLRTNPSFGDTVVDTIQFSLQAGMLTASHEPLVKLLNQKRALADFASATELAQFSDQDWIDMLAEVVDGNPVSAPAGIPGDSEAERRANYGKAISRMVEDLYPTAHVAYHLPPGSASSDVAGFVIANPGFSLQRTVIDDFFPTAAGLPAGTGDKEALRQDLLKAQRVFSVAPRYGRTAAVSTLLDGGITSAKQIQSMGPAAFKSAYATSLGGNAIAESVFESADKVASTALVVASQIRPEFHFPSMNVFTTPGCGDPDLEAIFGSLDYCECKHCDSVHGPAAYFVEIMNFLRGQPATGGVVMDKVVARRPELMHIKLNCENAETPLPTIDMVNEVLERAVLTHHQVDPHPDPATWPQTTWSPGDLAAHPEQVYGGVYSTYLSDDAEACFPLGLPFDLSMQEARIYLTHLGVERVALQDALAWFDVDLDQDAVTRVDERLGLSPGQAAIVRRTNVNVDLWELWGFLSETGWVDQMNEVETFMERSELSFEELQVLLRTDLLADVQIIYDSPCKLKDAVFRKISDSQVAGLDAGLLEKLISQLRLGRALGWTCFELDMVMRGLSLSFAQPVTDDLRVLGRFVRVRRSFERLALGEVLSWWASLDTRSTREDTFSFYEEAVRPNTRESDFKIANIDASVLTLDDVKGSLLGVLQLDEASLASAMAATGLSGASTLNLVNLSALYRVASIARATDLSVASLTTLVYYRQSIKEAMPAVFAGSPDAPIQELVDLAADVRRSGFKPSALDYVLRDKKPERFGASPADITRDLVAMITTLQSSDADHSAATPPTDLSELEQLQRLLARLYDGAQLADALGLIAETIPEGATQAQAVAARDVLFPFLTVNGDAYNALGEAFGPPDELARAKLVLPELKEHLLHLARERAAVQKLATLLDIETADADALLTAKQAWVDTMLADAFIAAYDAEADAAQLKEESFPKIFLDRADILSAAELYRQFHKIAVVIRTFRLSTGELRWLLANAGGAPVEILDLTDLPPSGAADSAVYAAYAGWDWVRSAMALRDTALGGPGDLVDILNLIFANPFSKADMLSALATSAEWEPSTLVAFEAPLSLTQINFQSLEAVSALVSVFAVAGRIGVTPSTALLWSQEMPTASQSAEIKGAAQAKYSATVWPGVAAPLRDRLRELQRDALANYLVPRLNGVSDRDDLFTHFLMDPEVSSCAKTSRLLFGTSAVQLFVQRALMGLETDVTLSDQASEEWVWMRRYRVWEANRKIFLYPENWVTPELRDDKTPLFRKLEEELSQSEITEDAVEDAYIHYLEGLHDIARLEVCGLYHELERDPVTKELVVDRLHVFGRTLGDPGRLFYRQRIDDSIWTPWEELPFQVESPDVIPVVANRRLILLWPKIEVKQEKVLSKLRPLKDDEAAIEPGYYREIRMMFTENRSGTWSGVRTSNGSIKHTPNTDILNAGSMSDRGVHEMVFFSTAVGKGADAGKVIVHVGLWETYADWEKGLGTVNYSETFVYDACVGDFSVGPAPVPSEYKAYYDGGGWPRFIMPRHLWIDNQGFRERNQSATSLQLPFLDAVTNTWEYPNIVVDAPDDFRTIFPRQDAVLRPSRPFVMRDGVATLFIREEKLAKPNGIGADLPSGSQDPGKLGKKTMTPYIGQVEETQATEQQDEYPQTEPVLSGQENAASQQAWNLGDDAPKYRVAPFYHPYACLFVEQVRLHGVRGLLDPEVAGEVDGLQYQTLAESLAPRYVPTPNNSVLKPYPVADIDFSQTGAYGVYNWELFHHIPMYIADRLMAERKFDAARRWLHYVFNPNRTGTTVEETDCKFYWKIRPFREVASQTSIEDLLALLNYSGDDDALLSAREDFEAKIAELRKNPFSPHAVARTRPVAYMRAVVMKYLDNLIAWGDDLFRQDTLESNNEATLYYALALQILGRRPRKIDAHERLDYTLDEAIDENNGIIDDFSNFLVEIENKIIAPLKEKAEMPIDSQAQLELQKSEPATFKIAYVTPSSESGPLRSSPKRKLPSARLPFSPFPLKVASPADIDPVANELYFCIPPNRKILSYWDTVADRLFKLRHCLNIDGIRRSLPLFEPPIDPALLAKAAAQGVDIGTAIANLSAPLPHYRFMSYLGLAKDFGGQVSSLGSALLQAIEKRDAEALALLRSGHEITLLAAVRKVKETALREADESIEALRRGRLAAEERRDYYNSRERVSRLESMEIEERQEGADLSREAGRLAKLASVLALIPDLQFGIQGYAATPVLQFSIGGTFASRVVNIQSQDLQLQASDLQSRAGITATYASYARREEEWAFQASLAERDIEQIDKQITGAELRKAMAEQEITNHDQQASDAAEVLEYMQGKFSSVELYVWMSGELSKLYFQAYNLAVDLARRAQRCFQYELAVDASEADFIAFGHWDNRRKGLLAGERLAQDLRRMEAAYYEKNRREYELTKRVSLASLDPVALVALRKTGSCHFFLPETIFDLDHPSHFMRRLKMVGVSVPAVTGPYTSMGATLTYESGMIRRSIEAEEFLPEASIQTVAISVGQDDTGLFEPNLRDERYLPFEGRGVADSSWRLELPATVRSFDYETISDVILTIRYTAREGGSVFGDGVQTGLADALQALQRADAIAEPEKGVGQVRLFSARAEFPDAWRAFIAEGTGGGAADLEFDLNEERFPQAEVVGSREVDVMAFFVRFRPDAIAVSNNDLTVPTLNGPNVTDKSLGSWAEYKDGQPAGYPDYVWLAAGDALDSTPGTFTLSVTTGWPVGKDPEDIMVLVQYKLS